MPRFDSTEHVRWLGNHMQTVLEYGQHAYIHGGFGYIRSDGSVDDTKPVELDLTARSTYIYAIASLLGIPGSLRRCEHGIQSISNAFKDPDYDGWFSLIEPIQEHQKLTNAPGIPAGTEGNRKSSRAMSYLLEAAAAASLTHVSSAKELLKQAITVEEKYFWNEEIGRVNETFKRDFSEMENYHGMSSNLHAVSAFLSVADATQDKKWIERAARIVSFAMEQARNNNWRVPEHFDGDWNLDRNYNVGTPADPRRPYGINVGHNFGWSRRIVQVAAALQKNGLEPPQDYLQVAREIFDRTAADSWCKDGHSGISFTVDYHGKPLMRQRFTWVLTEALQAVVSLAFALREQGATAEELEPYFELYYRWWDYLEGYVIHADGYWVGELNANNLPDDTVWPGAPDIYHSVSVLLTPRLPNAPSAAAAIAQGNLDHPLSAEHHKALWE